MERSATHIEAERRTAIVSVRAARCWKDILPNTRVVNKEGELAIRRSDRPLLMWLPLVGCLVEDAHAGSFVPDFGDVAALAGENLDVEAVIVEQETWDPLPAVLARNRSGAHTGKLAQVTIKVQTVNYRFPFPSQIVCIRSANTDARSGYPSSLFS